MYRCAATQPLLRCLNPEEQQQALETRHEGICGKHLVGRSLAFKILRQGFFWSTLRADASEHANKCKQCQSFATVSKQPPEEMASKFGSMAHPQGNRVIEVANKIICQGIKKRLGEAKERWADELPWVLWAYRTTPRSSTGETPFRMAYGTDPLVPVEVGLESYRTEVYNMEVNNFGLRDNVDLLEEEREAAHQKNELAAFMPTRQRKLQPNWEGPYKVVEVVRLGTYKLETLAGEDIKNTWHASHLRKFY
ncbi:uncharacterized protein LOC141664684 [Apium graveolens]|uniref:uncharacterized protein LOC141664684 n=1 Tax=Apium graveolens TaxID=4045 RepID=UPI003D7BA78E